MILQGRQPVCCPLAYNITPLGPEVKGGEAVHFTLDIRNRRCYSRIRPSKKIDSCA